MKHPCYFRARKGKREKEEVWPDQFQIVGNRSGGSMENVLEKSKSRDEETCQENFIVLSNCSVHQNHLEVLLKHRLLGSALILDSVGLG